MREGLYQAACLPPSSVGSINGEHQPQRRSAAVPPGVPSGGQRDAAVNSGFLELALPRMVSEDIESEHSCVKKQVFLLNLSQIPSCKEY